MTRQEGQSALSSVWLVGALTQAGRKTYSSALYEFSYLVLWSVLPFGLGGLVLFVTAGPSAAAPKDFLDLSFETFRNGELLVFTISLLAPTLFLVLHDPDGAKSHFPHKLPLSTIVMLVIVVCATLFSLQKAGTVKDPDVVFQISVVFTVLGLFLRYLAMVYHRLRMPNISERELRAGEHAFVDRLEKHMEEA